MTKSPGFRGGSPGMLGGGLRCKERIGWRLGLGLDSIVS